MSFDLAFGPDAHEQWGQIEVAMQEAILDELDRLASDFAWTTVISGELVHDLVIENTGVRHYIFFHLDVNRSQKRITVLGVGHYARRRDTPAT